MILYLFIYLCYTYCRKHQNIYVVQRFECLVLALALLINLVENCLENRQTLMDSMAAQKELGLCVKVSATCSF